MENSSNLWPLFLLSMLMVILAGFLAWLTETWSNEEEFPRPFIRGWFEGSWQYYLSGLFRKIPIHALWWSTGMNKTIFGSKWPKSRVKNHFLEISSLDFHNFAYHVQHFCIFCDDTQKMIRSKLGPYLTFDQIILSPNSFSPLYLVKFFLFCS